MNCDGSLPNSRNLKAITKPNLTEDSLIKQSFGFTETVDEVPASNGIIEDFGGNTNLVESMQTSEGDCFLKNKNDEFRKAWLVKQGNELYFFAK